MWDPPRLTTLWDSMACYRDSFTLPIKQCKVAYETWFPSWSDGGRIFWLLRSVCLFPLRTASSSAAVWGGLECL
jgi:hypothetical protein